MQAFIGMVDILTGRPENHEIATGPERRQVLNGSILSAKQELHPRGVNLTWQCSEFDECYGGTGSLTKCIECLKAVPADAVVLSTAVHVMQAARERTDRERAMLTTATKVSTAEKDREYATAAMQAIVPAMTGLKNLIWGTPPSYIEERFPERYRGRILPGAMERT